MDRNGTPESFALNRNRRSILLGGVAILLGLLPGSAFGHQDPFGCFINPSTVGISEFFVLCAGGPTPGKRGAAWGVRGGEGGAGGTCAAATCVGGPTPGSVCTDINVTGGQCGSGGNCHSIVAAVNRPKVEGETVAYQVSVGPITPQSGLCAISGGQLFVCTPDQVKAGLDASCTPTACPCHAAGSLGTTQQICVGCTNANDPELPAGTTIVSTTQQFFSDVLVPYTVRSQDIVSVGCPANSVRGRGFLSNGTIHDSDAGNTSPAEADAPKCNVVQTCIAKVDKEISCDGGLTFHDVGFESADEDGATDSCASWNAHDTVAAESITARYIVRNAGTANLVNCTIAESNTGITSSAIAVGTVSGGSDSTPVNFTPGCSDTLAAQEPDRADLTCTCGASSLTTTAFDRATFQCLTPGILVTKNCAVQDASGNSAITITVKNTGTVELDNCAVSDTNFTDAGCPANGAPTGTSHPVPNCSTTIASIAPGATAPVVTCADTGLTTNSCNTTTVTCDIKGSVGPKKLTGTAQDTCEVCKAQV